ncbi:MAG: hypothetical protein IJ167_05260 [Lachnospiraceae bacterium]|nr:hypothetical protein [Lachnospiraceae bacterium]
MNKVLIELFCAATIKKYDFWFPKSMLIKDVIHRIIEDIEDYENVESLFGDEENIMLYLDERGVILNRDYTVEQSGITSGQRIMMV